MRTPIPSKACLRVALFACCVAVLATPSAAERLPIKIFTSADGLGSSLVTSLMRDSRGFLWACTRDGLSRFDGSRFVTYQIGDKGAPPRYRTDPRDSQRRLLDFNNRRAIPF